MNVLKNGQHQASRQMHHVPKYRQLKLEGRVDEEKLVQARIWMYQSTRLEYLFAIEVQKAQVYKIDIPRYRQHKARKLVKEPKYR